MNSYPEASLTPDERERVIEKIFTKYNQPFAFLSVKGSGKKTVKVRLRSGATVSIKP